MISKEQALKIARSHSRDKDIQLHHITDVIQDNWRFYATYESISNDCWFIVCSPQLQFQRGMLVSSRLICISKSNRKNTL